MNLFLLMALQDIKASEEKKRKLLLYGDGTECNLDKRQKIWLIDVIALRHHKHRTNVVKIYFFIDSNGLVAFFHQGVKIHRFYFTLFTEIFTTFRSCGW